MPIIKVAGRSIDVDVKEELMQYEWRRAKFTEDKIIACSPFRDDNSPSFVVSHSGEFAGVFYDSAWEDEWWKSGTLPKLLSFLRNETYDEACQYLLDKYDVENSGAELRLAVPNIDVTQTRTEPEIEDNIKLDDEYLIGRGIHPKVIELNKVFDAGESIGIPWYDMNGRLAAVKYRKKEHKEFWYAKGSNSLSRLVYGLDKVVERSIKRAVVCEAEIDAMTWQSAGLYGIAIGGARLNEYQADLIISSGIEELILGGDNDSQGMKFNDRVAKLLEGKVKISRIDYTTFKGKKDANELGVKGIKEVKIIEKKMKIMLDI